jgi:hypothetical protein
MASRDELELLCSLSLDGELDEQQRAQLASALADPELRAFMASLEAAHLATAELAQAHRLPADFRDNVLDGAGARVIQGPGSRALWVAAAAVVLCFGIGITTLALHQRETPVMPPVAIRNNPDAARHPTARVVAFSDDEFEIRDARGDLVRMRRVDGQLAVPAHLKAPESRHTVIQVGRGTAVLAPGASARLSDVDADGTLEFEPVDGDLYLDGWARSAMKSRVADVAISVDGGGLMLRRTPAGYHAEPSYGLSRVGGESLAMNQCATISNGSVQVDPCDPIVLDAWAIEGRADAIKEHVRTILGGSYDQITPEQWQRGDKLLRGVLARPADRATAAYCLRMLLRHDFFDDAGEAELKAWTQIADILGEGTTDEDVPADSREFLRLAEEYIKQNPERVAEFKRRIRERLERGAEKRNGKD